MSFRIGLVGLCTSHPGVWVPVIRELAREKGMDLEIVAAWDSGETRPPDFAETFCAEHNIPNPVRNLEEMLALSDGVIVHTTNWDRHLEQACPFVEAGKSVYLDKPIAGNLRDLQQVADWMKQKKCVTGGSVLRYCREIADFLARPEEERGKPFTAYSSIGVDDYNYGIHGFSTLSGLFGPGIRSVRYLGDTNQHLYQINWKDGRSAFLTAGKGAWLPFQLTVTTDRNVFYLPIDANRIYRSMLEQVLPYFCRRTETPPVPGEDLLECEYAALAARISRMKNGEIVALDDLRADDLGYDGTVFALEYRRARMTP